MTGNTTKLNSWITVEEQHKRDSFKKRVCTHYTIHNAGYEVPLQQYTL